MKRFSFGLWIVCVALIGLKAQAAIEWTEGFIEKVYTPGFPAGDFYSYAPCAIREGNTQQIWFCRNRTEGIIRDHIYRIERTGGKISECEPVLEPTPRETWDSYHVCDPSVVSGQFKLDKSEFKYAMFYLGTPRDACLDNQIGVAFANELTGEWKKYSKPLVTYKKEGYWGVGQASAVNLEGKGRVLVFYTRGHKETAGFFREINLTDIAKPKVGFEKEIPVEGLTKTDGSGDYLNNFDIAYDATRDRFFLVREQHPYPMTAPTIISASLQVLSIPAKDLKRGRGKWTVEGVITPVRTGFARNHNAGFERTASGALPDANSLTVIFSTSCSGEECSGKEPLWTYGLWQISGRITEK